MKETRSGSDKVLVLCEDEIGAISDPPGGLILIEAAPFSHPIIRWLGRGLPAALMDSDQVNEWEPHAPVVLDSTSGELRAWDAPTIPETMGTAHRAFARPTVTDR